MSNIGLIGMVIFANLFMALALFRIISQKRSGDERWHTAAQWFSFYCGAAMLVITVLPAIILLPENCYGLLR